MASDSVAIIAAARSIRDVQRRLRRLAVIGALATSACTTGGMAAAPPAARPAVAPPLAGDESLVDDRLVFGRDIPTGGQVSESDWDAFMRDVITPVFPAGLTVFRGEGQWLDPRGVLVKEPSMTVETLHPVGQPADSVFERIANEYRRRFHQDAVLRETAPVRSRLYDSPVILPRLQSSCLGPDERSGQLVGFFDALVTPSTAADTAERKRLGLEGVDSSRVVLTTEARACAAAAQAMARLAQHVHSDYSVYVVRVGDAYGVMDPTWKSGEYTPVVLFDSTWKHPQILLGL